MQILNDYECKDQKIVQNWPNGRTYTLPMRSLNSIREVYELLSISGYGLYFIKYLGAGERERENTEGGGTSLP